MNDDDIVSNMTVHLGRLQFKSQGGRRRYKHPTKPGRATVPGQTNAELDRKTEKSILTQSGLLD
jgi:predicted RNA binding protein YcfA (HicA-like mRNA interferase family)